MIKKVAYLIVFIIFFVIAAMALTVDKGVPTDNSSVKDSNRSRYIEVITRGYF